MLNVQYQPDERAPNETPPNEIADFWNEVLAPKFINWRHILIDGFSRHSDRALSALGVGAGDRILDVACGFGDTAIAFARRVGPSGRVLGIDCCQSFLDIAEAEAANAGVDNVEFVAADFEHFDFHPEHDVCFSRFGAMYFTNPVVGFKIMRSALEPGGRMSAIVWRAIEDNPFVHIPEQIILDYLPEPDEDGRNCGPGPFSMADETVVRKQLQIAGFSDIEFEPVDVPMRVADNAREAVDLHLAIGPAGEVFREAGDAGACQFDDICGAMMRELSRYRTDEGIVMDSASWCITARNPG